MADNRPVRRTGERRGGKRFIPRRKVCSFCISRAQSVDYKDATMLRRYLSDQGKMEPRRKTGVCARHQRMLGTALKRARVIALLPYTSEHMRLSGDTFFRGRERRAPFVAAHPPAPLAAPTAEAPVAPAAPEVAQPAASASPQPSDTASTESSK